MRRREFVTLVGGATVGWPIIAQAQQAMMPVIGFLNSESPDAYAAMVNAFRQGLIETGYVEGENVTIEYRWAGGASNQLPAMAADLVRRRVAVIAANTSATIVARTMTKTIPIVFSTSSDPVTLGFVSSLNRPGGNVTGVSNLNVELGPKRLEVMHELVPHANIIALLVNPASTTVTETESRSVLEAAKAMGVKILLLNGGSKSDLDAAFATIVREHAAALIISAEASFTNRPEIVELAARHSIPTIYPSRDVPATGGLISYATSVPDMYRLVGIQTGRILRGEKPTDLPVQQSTKVELVVNLKTAKALGLNIPLPLLGRADEVIE